MTAIKELFPFGDVGDDTVAVAAERFPGLPADEIAAGFEFGKAIVATLQHFTDLLDESGLTAARWRLLMALLLQTPPEGGTIGELAGHLHVREPTVTATVDRLQKESLVQRNRDKTDRRVVRVSITQKGASTVAEVIPQVSARFRDFVVDLGGPENVRNLANQIQSAIESGQQSARSND